MFVLLLNAMTPELHRSDLANTVLEMKGSESNFSRIAQAEVKMHPKAAGSLWWREEAKSGMEMW
jgi:hypothetical protein